MFKNYGLLFFLLFIFSIPNNAQTYQNAESIEYDEARNRFLISNGNNILARASDGTLSFFGNGSASYGMEVMGNLVYALDPPQLKAFDLETEEQVMTLDINGTVFLNGLTSDGTSTLYATDFSAKKIYKINVSDLMNPTYEVIVENTINTPNGILYDGDNNRLIYTNWQGSAKIQAVDLSDFSISDLVATGLGNIDGIDDDSEGNYYISSWNPNGRITKYDANFENPITVTTPNLSNPADIGYAQAIDTLAIPQGNKADYIGFEVISNTKELTNENFQLLVYPNPATDQSWIQFELEERSKVRVRIVGIDGKVVYQEDNFEATGMHKIPMSLLKLSAGQYKVVLEAGRKSAAMSFVKF